MVRTRVGYAGGTTPRPTYHDLGGHAEALQLDYDPAAISYDELLELYFAGHRPTRPAWSSQYRSAIFYADREQEERAEAALVRVSERIGQRLQVELLPDHTFHRAEDYHQKYVLQRHGELVADLRAPYPAFRDFVDSTAAARLNGWLAGARPQAAAEVDLARLGLSDRGRRVLEKALRRWQERG